MGAAGAYLEKITPAAQWLSFEEFTAVVAFLAIAPRCVTPYRIIESETPDLRPCRILLVFPMIRHISLATGLT